MSSLKNRYSILHCSIILWILSSCSPVAQSNDGHDVDQTESNSVIWYDSINYNVAVFFDFGDMDSGEVAKGQHPNEAHFGGALVDCSDSEIHCLEGRFSFFLPKSQNAKEWEAGVNSCKIEGNVDNGEVTCFRKDPTEKPYRVFRYVIVDGFISSFDLQLEGYPEDAFQYEARDSGLEIKKIFDLEE